MSLQSSLLAHGCAVALLSFAVSAHADVPRQAEVVVTATRTPIASDSLLASTDVIDREAIETSGGDLLTVLRTRPGVDIVRSGGLGQQTSVFLRGGNSNHVLVLIDGVRVASANTGAYAWETLPLSQIERIEIVRGPRAAIFGSDAIGGVIQIFTRQPSAAEGMVGIASHDTWRTEVGFGQVGARGDFGLRVGYVDSGGFSAQNADGFSFDPDDDGFRQHSLNLGGGFNAEQVRLEGRLLHSRSDVEFDQGESRTDATSARIGLSGDAAEAPWSVAVAHSREDLDTPAYFSRYETRRWQLEAQRAHRVGTRGEWVYGLSMINDEGINLDTFGGVAQYEESRRQRALFVDWRDGHGALDWQLGARRDDYDSFGGETSLQGGLGWRISPDLRFWVNAGEGFRAPTLNELYSPGFSGLFAGNPDLDPEHSRTVEATLDWRADVSQVSLSAYRSRVRDLIDFSGGATFQATNIARADLRGIELEASTELGAWHASANLGWQRARNADTGAALLRRAARKATLALEREVGSARFGIELHGASARPDSSGELPGYGLLGGWLRWPVSQRWLIDLRLDNVFDRDDTQIRGYNTAGSTASIQLRWSGS